MRIIVNIIMILLLDISMAYGQALEISGNITDKEDGSPIAGAIIQIKETSGKSLDYTFASEEGSFSLKYSNPVSGMLLEIKQMGYRTISMNMDSLTFPMIIRLVPEATVLDDVVVRTPAITQRSDTLSYYVSQYVQAQDKNISDVLKRLPGIEVAEDGQIKYNGESINKFYINGSDFMGGRYGLATENISPEDVASVDVLENHQPLQVLKGIEFSQQAGLNIRLKEEARHKWVGILNSGLGAAPFLYDASVFAMRIAGKWQNMETVRVNNTGWNPSSQSKHHLENNIFGNGYDDDMWPEYISVGNYSSPLDERRTRNNFSVLANTTNSWHSGKGYDMMFSVTYENDRLDYSTGYVTDYFDSSIPSFEEWNMMHKQKHQVSGQWTLQVNRPELYVKDNLYVDASWNDAVSDVSGTLSLSQKSKTPSFSAVNDLQAVKRINDNLLTVSSRNRYIYKPHLLTVSSTLPVTQELIAKDFRSVTEARYGWLLGNWSIYARGGVDIDLHDLNSSLSGIETEYKTWSNCFFTLFNTWVAPEASWQSARWILTLSAPVSWHLHNIDDGTQNQVHNYMAVTPSVYARFQISAKTDIAAQIKYSLLPPSAAMGIGSLIMMDFRNLYMPQPVCRNSADRSAAIIFRYRNPVTALFTNLSAKFGWNTLPYMQNQLFLGERILTTFSATENESTILQLTGGISKGLMSGRVVLNLDAGYARSWAETMRQDIVSPYTVRAVMIQPGVKGNFTNWFSTDYKLSYMHNNMIINHAEGQSHDILKHRLGFTFNPNNKWQIMVGGEHYYTKFNSGESANLVLLDASAKWQVSKKVELRVTATNLLNEREYRYTDYGLLSGTDYIYGIRGRNILASIQIKL